ncbi:MAG: hypothetical protein H6816_08800 [Phycisphaerales bacterium]|nr:hypothetical protein [Phycisphaerales bacterium]
MAEQKDLQRDPIVHGSLAPHIFIAALLLAGTVAWAFYDEMWGKRPWTTYQAEFVERYPDLLAEKAKQAAAYEQGLADDPDIEKIRAQQAEAEAAAKDEIAAIDRRINEVINPRVTKLTHAMTGVRSMVTALVYQLEHAEGAEKERIENELERVKQEDNVIEGVPTIDGDGTTTTETYKYEALSAALEHAKAIKAQLFTERAKLDAPARALTKKLEQAMNRKRPGLSSQQVRGLISKVRNFDKGIKQIHVPDPIGLVDRCETCHLGIREPLKITAEDMGGKDDKLARTFVSHPTPELLTIHDPEKFGCTPCHGGNGAATVSVKEAHGKMKHWLWPMYEEDNFESGCLQCHEGSLVLDHAEKLNAGKELFRYRGCWGCHPREGFDTERAQQRLAEQAVRTVEDEITNTKLEIERQKKIADDPKATEAEFTRALKIMR